MLGDNILRFCRKAAVPSQLILGILSALMSLTSGAEPPALTKFLQAALTKEGDAQRGKALFDSEDRLGCTRCHTVDGSARRAGPDLMAVGDKFGRRELIEAVLTPSASIAVGYSTTTVQTRDGEEVTGILKSANSDEIDLMGGDAKMVKISVKEISQRLTSEVSLMPEGLYQGLNLQEFTDLIEYLVTLKEPSHSAFNHHGMPDEIPILSRPVAMHPMHSPELRFAHPVWLGPIPGESNSFLVAEHESGKVWRFESERAVKAVFLDTGVHAEGARGLLELAFHPQFLENRKYYIAKQVLEHGQFDSLVFEYEATPDLAKDSGRPPRLILRLKAASNVDHAGSLVFGSDGFLYIGTGDSGPPEDPQGHGQNTQVLLGKILRIDVDHTSGNHPYAIPRDNPFRDRPGFSPEIWAYGLREPWRFSFDSSTGDLWVGDVGQDRYEEIDLVRQGENYGWNVYEGFEPFSNRYRREGEKYTAPVFAYRRPFGPCVTGGYVYRGDRHSSFYGVYIFGDYQSRRLFGLTHQNRILKEVRQIGIAPERIASFAEGPSGELYMIGYEGTIYKMDLTSSRFE